MLEPRTVTDEDPVEGVFVVNVEEARERSTDQASVRVEKAEVEDEEPTVAMIL